MYKCNDCNRVFEQYDTITEESGEKWYVCPDCRSTDFDELTKRCEYCDNFFVESRYNGMCEDCIDEIEMRFSNMLHNNFTDRERKILNAVYDG